MWYPHGHDSLQSHAIFAQKFKRKKYSEKPSKGDGDWLTREEVCDMLHITYTTLWRKENDGVIQKHKIGRRNLYNKKEVEALLSSGVDIAVTHKK